jgi:ATP-dependent DNA ligase
VALSDRSSASFPSHIPQRHITAGATEELKLDGYRMIAVKSGRELTLHSRRGTNMTKRFEDVVAGPQACVMTRTRDRWSGRPDGVSLFTTR